MRSVIGGMMLSLFAAVPAFAVGASCEAQLEQIASLLQQKSNASATLKAQYDAAQRLCKAHQDEQAQEIARQMRSELAGGTTGADAPKSGSSSPPSARPTQPSR